ncbi:MAG: WG repeat-containing protein [Flavobacterium sp.]
MAKSFLIVLLIAAMFFSCKKEIIVDKQVVYVRVNVGGSWGFNDSKGNVVIPLGKYAFLNPIDDHDMIYATKGNKKGYIDIHQNEIVPIIYDELDLYSEGLAAAKIKDKYGFLDRKGKEVIAFQFDQADDFNSLGLALVKKNFNYGLINKIGVTIVPFNFQEIIVLESVKLIAVCKNNKWAFYSISGKPMSNFEYDEIKFTNSSLVLVRKESKLGFLDSNLAVKIPFGKYEFATNFNKNDLAIVSVNNRYGLINLKDSQVIRAQFDSIGYLQEEYSESDSYVGFKKNSLTLFDEKGNVLIGSVKDYFKDHVKINNKIKVIYQVQGMDGLSGVIDDRGNILIPLKYQEIEHFEGLNKTVVKNNGKYGLIDSKNKIVLPIDNEYVSSYKDEKYYIIKKNEKVGIVDYNFKILFDFIYQDISPCTYDHENRFIVKLKDKYGVIDRSGKVIIPFEYSEMSNWVEYGPGSNYHFVTKNEKFGLITKEGKVVIPAVYDKLSYVIDQNIILLKNGKYGVVTLQNRLVIPFEYEMICSLSNFPNKIVNEFYVQKKERFFVINNKNEVIRNKISAIEKEMIDMEMKFLKQ